MQPAQQQPQMQGQPHPQPLYQQHQPIYQQNQPLYQQDQPLFQKQQSIYQQHLTAGQMKNQFGGQVKLAGSASAGSASAGNASAGSASAGSAARNVAIGSTTEVEAENAAEFEDENAAEVEDIGEYEIAERRRLEQLDPGSMLVTELKKALKFEFPAAPKSGNKNELKDRLTIFRNAAKHHPATVYESEITDEELKGWS